MMITRRAWQWILGVLTVVTIYVIVSVKFVGHTDPVRIISFRPEHTEPLRINSTFGPSLDGIVVTKPPVKEISVTCDQETRLHRLRSACPAAVNQLEPGQMKTLKQHLVVDEKLKVIYCYVPKAGSSTWKKLLANFSGYHVDNKAPIQGDNILQYNMRFLSEFTDDKALNKLNNPAYMKFVAVRHPLDRLISAYMDKFVKVRYEYAPGVSQKIAKHYNPQRQTASEATLLEFLQYLTVEDESIKDEHWQKYTELCQPCAISYDLILKLETIDDDAQVLFNKISQLHSDINLGLTKPPPVLNPTNRNVSSSHKILKELADLPDEIASALYSVYKNDFELFGYSFDKKGHIALCEDAKKQCC